MIIAIVHAPFRINDDPETTTVLALATILAEAGNDVSIYVDSLPAPTAADTVHPAIKIFLISTPNQTQTEIILAEVETGVLLYTRQPERFGQTLLDLARQHGYHYAFTLPLQTSEALLYTELAGFAEMVHVEDPDHKKLVSSCRVVRYIPPGLVSQDNTGHRPHPDVSIPLLYWGPLEKGYHLEALLKGVALLPEALRLKIRLALVGKGSQQSELKKMIWDLGLTKQVTFNSGLKERDRGRVLRIHFLAIFPRFDSILAQAALEALAYGLPVLYSGDAMLTHPDQKLSQRWYVSDADKPEAWQSKLQSLLTDYDQLSRDRDQLQNWVTEHYSWPGLADHYLSFFALGEKDGADRNL